MISGLGAKLGTDSVPTHDYRDTSTWPATNDSGWVLTAPDGIAIVMSHIRLLTSNNADLHSPLHIIYKDRDGGVVKETVYYSLDDFLDRFTEFREIAPSRYTNAIEEHIYEFSQPIVLRSARSPEGTPQNKKNWYSLTIKIEDDMPYKAIGGDPLEFHKVRFPVVSYYIDTEYVPD